MTTEQKRMTDFISTLDASAEEFAHWQQVAQPFVAYEEAYPVALFHDLVEDGYCTLEQLKDMWNLSNVQVAAIDAITRRNEEPYFTYIDRVKENKLATKVKLVDLDHNIHRCANDLSERWSLIIRYAKAYGILIGE